MNQLINRLKLSHLIIGALLVVGLIPLLILSGVLTLLSEQELEESALNQLNATRAIKAKQVESYFAEREGDINVLSKTAHSFYEQSQRNIEIQTRIKAKAIKTQLSELHRELTLFSESYDTGQGLKAFDKGFVAGEPLLENARWRISRDIYGEHVNRFQEAFDWHDAYLINVDGYILYSSQQNDDLGLSVYDAQLEDSALANAFTLASQNKGEGNYFGDFAYYAPTNDYAAFLVRAVNDPNGQVVGYAALRLSLAFVNAILADDSAGLTSYLVGEDKKLRSDTPFISMSDAHRLNLLINTEATESKDKGAGLVRNYDGELVLAQWQPIKVSDTTSWTLVSELNINTALVPTLSGAQSYYEQYLNEYGYYDLFLVHPDGEIFYTVGKESDYKTNILSGRYSDSNLGHLMREVAKTKSFQMVDFAPYSPSQGAPASFMAMPVMGNENDVVFYLALQLSLDSINGLMQLREGMGETGETYLVGSDFRMRSDSYLDKEGHSVEASFAGDIEHNGVKTEATLAALSGQTGAKEILDYNGNAVLSSYSPISVGQTTWALIAEVDVAEAFHAISQMKNIVWMSLGATVLITVLFSLYLAHLIRKPLGGEPRDMMELAEQIAQGDLTYTFDDNTQERSIYGALSRMSSSLKVLISNILESSQALASTAEETAVASEQTTTAVSNQQADTEMVATAINQMTSTVHDVAKNTESAALVAKEVHQRSTEGLELLQESIKTNNALMLDVQAIAQNMDVLMERTQQVDQVLTVIQTIAEQTNLLALNAAIEAARAGEHGRGFAVVADEVRSLASKTQGSTSDIQSMLTSLKEAANTSVQNMKRSVEQAEAANILSNQTAESFDSITQATVTIDDMMAQISTASEEQVQVSEDINQRVAHIAEVSIETSAIAQQLSAASQEVARSSEALTEQTQSFKV